jgi:signal peptidase I
MRRLVLALLVLAVAVRWVVGRLVAVTVVGDSMAPAFADGDRVLVARTSPRRLRVGDVVVAWLPGMPGAISDRDRPWLVKRVAALAGDPVPATVSDAVGGDALVRPGQTVLLSDNADGSLDSRGLGYVSADLVVGRVVRRLRA